RRARRDASLCIRLSSGVVAATYRRLGPIINSPRTMGIAGSKTSSTGKNAAFPSAAEGSVIRVEKATTATSRTPPTRSGPNGEATCFIVSAPDDVPRRRLVRRRSPDHDWTAPAPDHPPAIRHPPGTRGLARSASRAPLIGELERSGHELGV